MGGISDAIELSPIKQMEILASQRHNVVSLAQGIPSFDTPEQIKQGAIEAITSGRAAQYSLTAGLLELRGEIEDELARMRMFYDFEKEIIVTVGSIEGICSTLLAILDPGDEVILLSPTYASYIQAIKVARGVPVHVCLSEEDGWALDTHLLENKITDKTRAILLCNPNNPTGSVLNKEQLLSIGQIAEKNNLIIISDEVYKDFIYNEEDKNVFFTLASVSSLRKNVVRIFSYSKAYSMTGWRVGYLHTDVSLAQKILKVHDSLVTCAPVVAQYAAMAALRQKASEWRPYLNEYAERRRLMCRELDKLGDHLSYVYPEATYFVFPRINVSALASYGGSFSLAKELLSSVGLAVVPGVAFGPNGEDHIRLSFGRSREIISEGMNRLIDYFKKYK